MNIKGDGQNQEKQNKTNWMSKQQWKLLRTKAKAKDKDFKAKRINKEPQEMVRRNKEQYYTVEKLKMETDMKSKYFKRSLGSERSSNLKLYAIKYFSMLESDSN